MKRSERVFWGVALIGAAVFLLLNQLGLIEANIGVGTIVMGIICAAILIGGIANRSFGGIFFSLGLAWLVFDDVIGLPDISIWMIIVIVIFLTCGFNILFPKKPRQNNKWQAYDNVNEKGKYQQVVDKDVNGNIFCTNRFGATAKYINAVDFKGGELHNSFGEMKVYFDGAVIVNPPVQITVNNSFGQITLFVPKTWCVKTNIGVFAADIKEENRGAVSLDGPVVNITGNTSFGEVLIVYV